MVLKQSRTQDCFSQAFALCHSGSLPLLSNHLITEGRRNVPYLLVLVKSMHENMSRGIQKFNYDFVHFASCFHVPVTCQPVMLLLISSKYHNHRQLPKVPRTEAR